MIANKHCSYINACIFLVKAKLKLCKNKSRCYVGQFVAQQKQQEKRAELTSAQYKYRALNSHSCAL